MNTGKDLFVSKTTWSAIGSFAVLAATVFGVTPETAQETVTAIEKTVVMAVGAVTLLGTLWGRWKAESKIGSVMGWFKRDVSDKPAKSEENPPTADTGDDK